MIDTLCPPALLYIVFSLTHIIIDVFKQLYNTAFLKFLLMIIFTLLLNILCKRGLGIISWVIVFIPFIMMTIITTIILIAFNLSPSVGNMKYSILDKNNNTSSIAPTASTSVSTKDCILDCDTLKDKTKTYHDTISELKDQFTMMPVKVNKVNDTQCDVLYDYTIFGSTYSNGQDKRRFTFDKDDKCNWNVTSMGDYQSGASIQN